MIINMNFNRIVHTQLEGNLEFELECQVCLSIFYRFFYIVV